MFTIMLVIHILVAVLLITSILMQSGRGGGLTETFSSMESIFGTKTNVFLVRTTTALAVMFLITCLSLAYISTQRGRSLVEQQPVEKKETTSIPASMIVPKTEEVGNIEEAVEETKEVTQEQQIPEEIESPEETIKEE